MHALAIRAPDRGRKVSMEGLVSLSNHPIRILFDYGASHSFISSSVVESLHLIISMVVDPVVVSNPIGGSAHLSIIFQGLKICVLGAILDCEKRVVRLLTYHGRTLEISYDPQGSVMLSFLESLDEAIDDLQSVPVVRD